MQAGQTHCLPPTCSPSVYVLTVYVKPETWVCGRGSPSRAFCGFPALLGGLFLLRNIRVSLPSLPRVAKHTAGVCNSTFISEGSSGSSSAFPLTFAASWPRMYNPKYSRDLTSVALTFYYITSRTYKADFFITCH